MSVATLLNDIVGHDCYHKRILSSDNVLARRLGWTCMGCGKLFEIRLVDMKQGICPEWAKELMYTIEGRTKMARIFTAGNALIVMDEVGL